MYKIVVFNPNIILGDTEKNFHGYAEAFILKYADYIYAPNPQKRKKIKEKLKEDNCQRKIQFIRTPFGFVGKELIFVGFGTNYNSPQGIQFSKGKKFFHLLDYYIDIKKNKTFLKRIKCDAVIEHGQVDKYSDFYKKYYSEYIGKTISLPFGYGKRFKLTKSFKERQKKAIGLGSINKIADQKLKRDQIKELIDFYEGREYQHEVRKYLRDNADAFKDCIDCRFPTDKDQKGRDYDAVEALNSYQMFINDEGFSGFLPARTYEGIACGTVMVAPISDLYKEMGFIPDVNYIAYKEGDYADLKAKIWHYIMHQDELIEIQKKSVELSEEYTHEKIADMLYEKINNFLKNEGDLCR